LIVTIGRVPLRGSYDHWLSGITVTVRKMAERMWPPLPRQLRKSKAYVPGID
jgi:hypothetical protein